MVFVPKQFQEQIARTGFLSCLASYGIFWLLDLMRPGFVARYFSVHIFLLGVIVFGIWWANVVSEYADHRRVQWIFAGIAGLFLSVITFQLGDAFGIGRVFLGAMAFFVPLLVLRLIRYK